MTTINDISDLVRILQERPDWRAVISNLLVGEDLLNLPRQLAQFIEATAENFRLVNENLQALNEHARQTDENFRLVNENLRLLNEHAQRTDENFRLINENLRLLNEHAQRTDERAQRVDEDLQVLKEHAQRTDEDLQVLKDNYRSANGRLNRLEGRVGNLEGKNYQHSIGHRVVFRAERHFGLNNPIIAMADYFPKAPGLNRLFARAIQSGSVTYDDLEDLHEADLIISDDDNRYVVVEASLTADSDDIQRAARRANVMAAASGTASMPVVVTTNIPEPQRELAERLGVAVFIMPDR